MFDFIQVTLKVTSNTNLYNLSVLAEVLFKISFSDIEVRNICNIGSVISSCYAFCLDLECNFLCLSFVHSQSEDEDDYCQNVKISHDRLLGQLVLDIHIPYTFCIQKFLIFEISLDISVVFSPSIFSYSLIV